MILLSIYVKVYIFSYSFAFVWTDNCFPLLVLNLRQQDPIQVHLPRRFGYSTTRRAQCLTQDIFVLPLSFRRQLLWLFSSFCSTRSWWTTSRWGPGWTAAGRSTPRQSTRSKVCLNLSWYLIVIKWPVCLILRWSEFKVYCFYSVLIARRRGRGWVWPDWAVNRHLGNFWSPFWPKIISAAKTTLFLVKSA